MVSDMELIPVLDIRHGVVVRGVAGKRECYRPIQSNLVESAAPCEVLTALEQFEPRHVYIADLDGIERDDTNLKTLSQMVSESTVKICVDSGVRSIEHVEQLLELGVSQVVLGLESLPSFDWLAELRTVIDAQRLIFSLDLRLGVPMQFQELTPLSIIERVVESGVIQLIVLDLAAVGVGQGIPTLPLCTAIRQQYPGVKLWTGGGVNSWDDVKHAASAGVDGVLVASALHDGRITAASRHSVNEH